MPPMKVSNSKTAMKVVVKAEKKSSMKKAASSMKNAKKTSAMKKDSAKKGAMKKDSAKKGAMKKSSKKKSSGLKSAMKAKKVKKTPKTGRYFQVLNGTREKTKGGLKKSDLKKNKDGRVVSAKKSALAKKRFYSTIKPWSDAVIKARKALGISGFQAVGGNTEKGKALLAKARSFYKK